MKSAALTFLAASIVALALAGTPVSVGAVSCGDTIPANSGTVVLSADLSCSGTTGGLNVHGPGTTLDMAGHKLICNPFPGPVGITLFSKATLRNGVVQGCFAGVRILGGAGTGDNRVENMVVFGEAGFEIDGDNNTLAHCDASFNRSESENLGFGFSVKGNSNELNSDTAWGNRGHGFLILGDSNDVKRSAAVTNGAGRNLSGFSIVGNRNTLSNNTSSDNFGAGFSVEAGADQNEFDGNTAIGNGIFPRREVIVISDGFRIVGPEGLFVRNLAIYNSGSGFSIETGSALNELDSNTATTNGDAGILLRNTLFNTLTNNRLYTNFYGIRVLAGSGSNDIENNVSLQSSSALDLSDDNPSCDDNIWFANIFGMSFPADCIH